MRARLAVPAVSLIALLPALDAQDAKMAGLLSGVSGAAEAFLQTAPRLLARETLEQRVLIRQAASRPSSGPAAHQPTKPEYRTRTIVSEYGLASFNDAPNALHEFRQIISVDGRSLATPEQAAQALAIYLRDPQDEPKRRMLQRFAERCLPRTATDFGQVLLLFRQRRLGNFSFHMASQTRLGADLAIILQYFQQGGTSSLRSAEGANAAHQPLGGEIWVRKDDPFPLRVTVRSRWKEGKVLVGHEAFVDYIRTPDGVIAPVSVIYRQLAGFTVQVENVFRYSDYRVLPGEPQSNVSAPAGK